MRVLLVKMSSMGDVVHNLPLVADIKMHWPAAAVDWVVEEAYAPLVRLHAQVDQVIPVALRRWRRQPWRAATWREWRALRAALRAQRYDAIIDTQALLKSALIGCLARGRRVGFAAASCREPAAARLYHTRLAYPPVKQVHAVKRYRDLAAFALGYTVEGAPRYGLQGIAPQRPQWLANTGRYALFFHSTARAAKLWSEASWSGVAQALAARGITSVLAWGSAAERERAERIAGAAQAIIAPAPLGLLDWAAVATGASLAVGLDTGLTYLAAAVGTPVVALYVDSAPAQAGVIADTPHANLGDIGAPPSAESVIEAALRLQR